MKKKLLCAACTSWVLAAGAVPAYAQDASSPQVENATQRVGSGVITGRVVEPATGEYLRNAIIRINGRQVAVSGDAGEFRINNAPAGTVELSVEFTGYNTETVSVNVVPGETVRQEVALRSSLERADRTLDAVTVVGIREGDARAIMEQRASMNIVNTLSADSFGDIGDGNPAEFLKYMPGVDFDSVADDVPRNISLRGLPARYTRVTVNGITSAGGADANTSTTSPTARTFSFEQMALAQVESINISKTVSADMDADAPAGTIDIRTKKAFDRKGRSVVVQLGGTTHTGLWDEHKRAGWQEGGYGSRKFLPMGSITYSDVFLDGRFGINAGISSTTSYVEHEQTTANRNYIPTALSPDPYAVTSIAAATYYREYGRKSAALGLDFKATDDLTLSLVATTAKGDIDPSTNTTTFTTNARSRGVLGGGDAALDFTTNSLATANTLQVNHTFNYKVGHTRNLIPSFEWNGGNFKLDGHLIYSDSNSGYDPQRKGQVYQLTNTVTARGNFSAVRSDLLDQDWNIQQTSGGDWSDPASFTLSGARPIVRTTLGTKVERKMSGGGVNFSYFQDIGNVPVTWKTGFKSLKNTYDFSNDSDAYLYTYNGPMTNAQFLAAVQSSNQNSYANSGMTVTTLNGGELYDYSLATIYQMMQANPGEWTHTMTAANWYAAYVANARKYEEQVDSVYFMGTADFTPKLKAQAGLRWERTTGTSHDFDPLSAAEVAAAGYAVDAATGRATTIAGLEYQYMTNDKVERKGSYNNLFPSASVKYSFSNSLDLIAGYSRTIGRPDVSLLSGVWSINVDGDGGTVVTAPNPNLQSESSDNYSVRLVKYFEPVGLVAVNYYRNKIKNGFVSTSLTAEEFGYTGTEFADATFESWTNRSEEAFSIDGYELEFNHAMDYLPGILKGLTVRGSLLVNDPDIEQQRVATRVGQLSLGWNYGRWRVNINTVSANEKSRGPTGSIATPNGNVVQSQPFQPYWETNLSASYAFLRKGRGSPMGLEMYFTFNNVFDNNRGTWYPNSEVGLGPNGHHSQIYIYTGQKASFGLRARF